MSHQGGAVHSWLLAVLLAVLVPTPRALGENSKPERTDIKIAVGGKSLMIYLPLTVTERLGYFKEAGLNVEITDFQGGSKSLQALIGGNVDVAAGSFDHTIEMQAKGQAVIAVVETGRYPGIVLGLMTAKHLPYRGPVDLRGLRIGVTAPGSQTSFLAAYVLAKAGLSASDAAFIGVGGASTAVAAARSGQIDALSHADPAISELETKGELTVLFDTRTKEGTHAVFGGDYPSSVLYMRRDFVANNPNAVQALVSATVRALRWIEKASPEQISAVMPAEFAAGNRDLYVTIIGKSKAMYPPDGRLDQAGAENAYRVLSAVDPAVTGRSIDLSATFTDRFVDRAAR